MSALCHFRSHVAGRRRKCHPEQDRSCLPFWISARGTDVPPSHRAAAHGHSSHFRFEMVRKQIWSVWLLLLFPSCSLLCMVIGATCLCQTEQCWGWQQLPGSCSCTHCLGVRWEMWHQKNQTVTCGACIMKNFLAYPEHFSIIWIHLPYHW